MMLAQISGLHAGISFILFLFVFWCQSWRWHITDNYKFLKIQQLAPIPTSFDVGSRFFLNRRITKLTCLLCPEQKGYKKPATLIENCWHSHNRCMTLDYKQLVFRHFQRWIFKFFLQVLRRYKSQRIKKEGGYYASRRGQILSEFIWHSMKTCQMFFWKRLFLG